jgi:hypothetical protein
LSFRYGSTRFGHPYAHHQEPINCSISLWFTYGKPEADAAVDKLLMMGIRMPETC